MCVCRRPCAQRALHCGAQQADHYNITFNQTNASFADPPADPPVDPSSLTQGFQDASQLTEPVIGGFGYKDRLGVENGHAHWAWQHGAKRWVKMQNDLASRSGNNTNHTTAGKERYAPLAVGKAAADILAGASWGRE